MYPDIYRLIVSFLPDAKTTTAFSAASKEFNGYVRDMRKELVDKFTSYGKEPYDDNRYIYSTLIDGVRHGLSAIIVYDNSKKSRATQMQIKDLLDTSKGKYELVKHKYNTEAIIVNGVSYKGVKYGRIECPISFRLGMYKNGLREGLVFEYNASKAFVAFVMYERDMKVSENKFYEDGKIRHSVNIYPQ